MRKILNAEKAKWEDQERVLSKHILLKRKNMRAEKPMQKNVNAEKAKAKGLRFRVVEARFAETKERECWKSCCERTWTPKKPWKDQERVLSKHFLLKQERESRKRKNVNTEKATAKNEYWPEMHLLKRKPVNPEESWGTMYKLTAYCIKLFKWQILDFE